MLLQILRRGTKYAPHRKEFARNQFVRTGGENLQGAINACLDRIDYRIADDQVHAYIWIRGLKLVQQRCEVAQHQTGQCMDPQGAGGFGLHIAHLIDHAVGLGHQFRAIAQKRLAQFTQPNKPGAAVKQSGAQIIFKLLDAGCHHRLGNAQLSGRFSKALGLRDTHKSLYVLQSVHSLNISASRGLTHRWF